MNALRSFTKKLNRGFILVLIVGVSTGVIGLQRITTACRQAAIGDQANACLDRFQQLRECDREFLRTANKAGSYRILAENSWNRAKEKFLNEVQRLSQTSSLDEREKRLIQSIQKAWKGYEAGFHKYVLAARAPDKSAGDILTLRQTDAAAQEIIGREEARTGLRGLRAEARSVRQATLHEAMLALILLTAGILTAGTVIGWIVARGTTGEAGLTPEQIAAANWQIRQLTESIAAASRDPGYEDWPTNSPKDVTEESVNPNRSVDF